MDGLQFLSSSTGAPANLDLSLSIGFPLENPLYKERCSSKCLKTTVSEQASSKARRLSNQHRVAAMQAARLGRDRGRRERREGSGEGRLSRAGADGCRGPRPRGQAGRDQQQMVSLPSVLEGTGMKAPEPRARRRPGKHERQWIQLNAQCENRKSSRYDVARSSGLTTEDLSHVEIHGTRPQSRHRRVPSQGSPLLHFHSHRHLCSPTP
ncbi:uncharacterized protein LOC132527139 isoform X2 [Lagenorhynchus albirostris]|uniref:uncharacterized protein LOC132527139 isoform X2 n=1 Tax=Lagenorhynchus albirostris TaxID=27610 RepID=UPI0028EE09BE|nr:uncharacterized protein LOC132527139 isoform X2 [Lagenorhynchus albirostris]